MGNYIQYFVITYIGKEYEKESKSLSCTPGTKHHKYSISQFSRVTQSCPTLCNPISVHHQLPVHYQLPELAQTHVHRIGDTIQPSLYLEYI